MTTNLEGAVLLQESLHGAAARAAIQPQHQGAALRVALGLHKPTDAQLSVPSQAPVLAAQGTARNQPRYRHGPTYQ